MSRILLVEDEEHIAQGLAFNLRNAGYYVDIAGTGEEALERIRANDIDLVLLDVMLPGIDGIEVCKTVRQERRMLPIVMVSAQDRVEDAVAGLDAGADDYITKPFDLDMLLAKVRGALRRQVWGRTYASEDEEDEAAGEVSYGEWTIDLPRFRATHPEKDEVELSAKEVGMLRLFSRRPGEVISRDTFLEEVWEMPGSLETRTVDNFIHKLRQTFEDDPKKPEHIVSVRGAGYRFVP